MSSRVRRTGIEDLLAKPGRLFSIRFIFKEVEVGREMVPIGFEADFTLPTEKRVAFMRHLTILCMKYADDLKTGGLKWEQDEESKPKKAT